MTFIFPEYTTILIPVYSTRFSKLLNLACLIDQCSHQCAALAVCVRVVPERPETTLYPQQVWQVLARRAQSFAHFSYLSGRTCNAHGSLGHFLRGSTRVVLGSRIGPSHDHAR
jgi:hypothetical protein